MCISWTIKCLILLTHGATMKFILSAVISPTVVEMRALMTVDGLKAHRKASKPHYEDKMVNIFQTIVVVY